MVKYFIINRLQVFIFLFLLTLTSHFAFGTHMMGGNIELKVLDPAAGKYKISLKVYVDRTNYTSGADGEVGVWTYRKSNDTQMDNFTLYMVSEKTVVYENETCTEKRRLKTSLVQYEKEVYINAAQYTDVQGYYIAVTHCCRNAAIVNLEDPLNTTMRFRAFFPPLMRAGKLFVNSTPSFEEIDGGYVCLGDPFSFPFGATDPDGDELKYSMQTPFGYNSNTNGPVIWSTGYSASNSIPGNPALKVDPKTGELFVVPSQLGLFVFSVMVEEFRNGEKIGSVQRDYQLYVVDCPPVAPPDPIILVDNNPVLAAAICEGKVVSLTPSVTNPDWNYQWKKNGRNIQDANKPALLVSESGEYQLVTSLAGTCSKSSRSSGVKIDVTKSNFDLKADGKPMICGNGGKLTLRAIRNDNYTYEWFRNGTVLTSKMDSMVATSPGNYWVVVTDIVQGCRSLSDTLAVLEVPAPMVELSVENAKTELCKGDSVQVKATERNDYSYQWFANGQETGHVNAMLYISTAGNFRVMVTDSAGCQNTSAAITVSIVESINVSFTPVEAVCLNLPAIPLHGNPAGGVFSGPGVNGDTFVPKDAGTGHHELRYTVKGSASCPEVSAKEQVTVWSLPPADAGKDVVVSEGGSASLGTPELAELFYSWSPPDGLDDTSNPRPVVTPLTDTEYTLQVTDLNGCSSFDKVFVRMFNNVWIPDAFSPNGDGKNDTWELHGINSYPTAQITIYNRWGEVVFYSKGYQSPFDGKVKGLMQPSGVYVYSIKLDETSAIKNGTLMLLN